MFKYHGHVTYLYHGHMTIIRYILPYVKLFTAKYL